MARLSGYAIALMLGTLAGGCFDLSDSRGPVMSVDLCWDEQPGDGFKGGNCAHSNNDGTCDTAGVTHMTWSLKPVIPGMNIDSIKEVAGASESCANGIDIVEPSPGAYTLEITGQNSDGEMLWQHTCKGLDVLRFDIGYECDIDEL
jgi:hypothetical protein